MLASEASGKTSLKLRPCGKRGREREEAHGAIRCFRDLSMR